MAETSGPRTAPGLDVGTRVEVRTGFDRSWSRGFVVVEVTDIGYRLRRESDASLLPVVFVADDVRRERKSSMWWF
jgi:hypothetical protein